MLRELVSVRLLREEKTSVNISASKLEHKYLLTTIIPLIFRQKCDFLV